MSDVVIDGGFDDLPLSEEQIRAALSYTDCIAGALTIDTYLQMLIGAGFAEPRVTIRYRHLSDNPSALPESLRVVSDEQQKALLARICSAYITARKI